MRKAILILTGTFVVTAFLGLRVYGAFQREKSSALQRAEQAKSEVEVQQLAVAEDKVQLACADAWGKYHFAEAKAENTRITQGEVAYAEAEAKIFEIKPICDYDLSLDEFNTVDFDVLDHQTKAISLNAYAKAERDYAANRKLQAKYLMHKALLYVAGTKESDEDRVKFLFQHEGVKAQ